MIKGIMVHKNPSKLWCGWDLEGFWNGSGEKLHKLQKDSYSVVKILDFISHKNIIDFQNEEETHICFKKVKGK
jgi:hypothetical protein